MQTRNLQDGPNKEGDVSVKLSFTESQETFFEFTVIPCGPTEMKELYNGSAFTIEGVVVDKENLEYLYNWFKKYGCDMKQKVFYNIKGKTMNDTYGLTGSNAYPDDTNILCVKLEDLTNVSAIVVPRFRIGARWFDDVVDNNERRQREIDGYDE